MTEIEKLERAMAVLTTHQATFGETVVQAALTVWRERIAALKDPEAASDSHTEAQQRKLVSVLFADVSGFTAMSETMDAEDVAATMNALWQKLDSTILAAGGKIAKHIGDAVMALWGVDITREDDPEHAVRAALAMQTEIREFNSADPKRGVPLNMRIGINTGYALLGTVGMVGEFSAIGETVNLAPHLEHAAPVGGVLISGETLRHVLGLFDVEEHAPLTLPNKPEPIPTYSVKRVRLDAFRVGTRGVEGIETRMVGREAELKKIKTTMQYVAEHHRVRAMTVYGESGMGKSRLSYEVTAWLGALKQPWRIFKGRADQTVSHLPYAVWRDIFSFRFEIQDSDPLSVAREKMERGFLNYMPADPRAKAKAHIVGQLIGLDFSTSPHVRHLVKHPRKLHEVALYCLTEFFKATTAPETPGAAPRPTALFIDDVQWADPGSLDLLEQFVLALPANTPLFVFCLARPILIEHRPLWGESLNVRHELHHHLILWSLPIDTGRQLASEILRKVPHPSEALLTLIATCSEGNPFYIEEFIKLLIDAQVIELGDDQWRVDEARLATLRLPAETKAILPQRLERLSEAEREVLQRAAVLGRIFWDSALEALSLTDDKATLYATLDKLRAREIVFVRALSAFAEAQEYTFKHILFRHATYYAIPEEHAHIYRVRAAEWLTRHSGERLSDYAGMIAEHYHTAGQMHLAADYWLRAADRAQQAGAYAEALEILERALYLVGQSDTPASAELRLKILVHLGEVRAARGEATPATDVLQTALFAARHTSTVRTRDQRIWLGRALRTLGELALTAGQFGAAQAYWEESLALARELNQPAHIAEVLNSLGGGAAAQKDFAKAIAFGEQALAIFRTLKDPYAVAQSLSEVGWLQHQRGEPGIGKRYSTEAVALARQTGSEALLALTLYRLGAHVVALKDHPAALAALTECVRLAWALGELEVVLEAVLLLAQVWARTEQTQQAQAALNIVRVHPTTPPDARATATQLLADAHWAEDPAPPPFEKWLVNTVL